MYDIYRAFLIIPMKYLSYLPFSREQYRRYINQYEKIVLITARIEVQFEDDICGVGIEVL